jgi:hypothetical protein
MFYHEMVEFITKAVVRYAKIVRDRQVTLISSAVNHDEKELQFKSSYIDIESKKKSKELEIYQKVIIEINNVERVRESLHNFLNEIQIIYFIEETKKIHTEEEIHQGLEMHRVNLEELVNQTSELMVSIIELTLESVLNIKVKP